MNDKEYDLTTPEGVKEKIRNCKTSEGLMGIIDEVTFLHDGGYPEWWYKEIIASGVLMDRSAYLRSKEWV